MNTTQASSLLKQCEEIGRLLGGMIAKSGKFCSTAPTTVVREDAAGYFTRNKRDDELTEN